MSRIGRLAAAGTLVVAGFSAFAAPAQAAQAHPQDAMDCVQVLADNGYSEATGYPQFLLADMCRLAEMNGDIGEFREGMESLGVDDATIDNAFGAAQE